MSAHGGPNIVEDGLVLALDAANIKSFRGIPTVNYLSNPTQTFNAGEFYQYYDLRPIFETYGLVPYSLSFEARGNIPGYCLVYMQNGSYTKYAFVSTVIDLTTDWKLYTFENITPSGPTSAWQQNTPGDNRAMLATYTIYGTGRNPQIRNMQLELGTVATPFVDGTRGTTVATGGGWADRSGNGNNGELVNGPTYNSSNGGSIVFDGVNDYVLSSNNSTFGNNTTWDCWVYCSANVSTYNMFMGRGLPYFSFFNGNRLFFSNVIGGSQRTIETASNLSLNTWYYATFITSYDGTNTTMKIYTNGAETASGTWESAQGNYSLRFMVGDGNNFANTSWYPFSGRVSNVKIHNRTLSPAEILQNYNATKGRYGL